jgi:hypothetical protein
MKSALIWLLVGLALTVASIVLAMIAGGRIEWIAQLGFGLFMASFGCEMIAAVILLKVVFRRRAAARKEPSA